MNRRGFFGTLIAAFASRWTLKLNKAEQYRLSWRGKTRIDYPVTRTGETITVKLPPRYMIKNGEV